MNFHEYQAKELFKNYGLQVPSGVVVTQTSEIAEAVKKINATKKVIKAQVHAGGRGKAGGIKLCESIVELEQFADSILGKNLITYQTDNNGMPVNSLLIEETSNIEQELYLGMVIDRSLERVVIITSTEGGMEIEKVAKENPEKIHTLAINPVVGFLPWQARNLGFKLELEPELLKQFSKTLSGLCKLFLEKDLSLIEINPLVITKEKQLVCLDGKINFDDNAAFRHQDIVDIVDKSQEDNRELEARKWGLNYVPLEGSIGCMVNGAGLAMATMDIIKLNGAEPANFLDVGGTATAQRVAKAFEIILLDKNVKGILVNIFGGIVRCDLIAEGIIQAFKKVNVNVPLVVRLEGNNAKLGLKLLSEAKLNILAEKDLTQAVKQIVSTSRK